jgi:hypothetical protein
MARGRIFTARLTRASQMSAAERRASVHSFDIFCISQRVRIAENHYLDNARIESDRWATGAWEGRDRLELEEVRR